MTPSAPNPSAPEDTTRQSEPRPRRDGYVDLASYAPIGNGRTVALVAQDGSIDWFPVQDLDSAPTFGRLLDAKNGGSIELRPRAEFSMGRSYLPGTNLLQTTFTTAGGSVRVTDSVNVGSTGVLPWSELARRIEGLDGQVEMEWSVAPGTMLGTASPWVQDTNQGPVLRVGEVSLGVRGEGIGEGDPHDGRTITGSFSAGPGSDHLLAVVGVHSEPLRLPTARAIRRNLDLSVDHWRRWIGLLEYEGPFPAEVERSALLLKLLTHDPSGSLAAAATTSLPENRDGTKNFDYRFAWIRDATYTLQSLIGLGEMEDVHAAVAWLLRLTRDQSPNLHVLNRLNGEVPGTEMTEFDAPGWRGIGPAVAGNAAADQLQLGVYNDVFDMASLYVEAGNVLDPATGRMLADLADVVCDIWRRPDAGMWELPEHRHYTSSKMACNRALTSAVALAEAGQVPGHHDRWRLESDRIREFVDQQCWSDERGAYVFYPGTNELDVSVLLHAISGYDRGPRMSATIDALRAELGRGPLQYRYSGMEHEEGAFVACSFWTVAALVQVGRREEALELMEQMLPLGNDIGMFAEMIDPTDMSFLGNLPQALSHLAVLTAALHLAGEQHGTEA